MRVVKFLFLCHLIALIFVLGGLLLASPHFGLWNIDQAQVPAMQFFLGSAGALQILLGAATMLLFGLFCVGPAKTLTFFAASLCVSFTLGLLITGKTALLGLFFMGESPGVTATGLNVSFILLAWFYMGFTSYLLACKLTARLRLRRQTLWSLILGTYFLLAWDIALDAALAGTHLPVQTSLWHAYSSHFGLPVYNAVNWAINGLLFLGVSRLLWRADLDTQHLTTWLPFGVYTANIVFIMVLSFGIGLWFPLFLLAVLILAPESLAFFPREELAPSQGGPLRASLSQAVWLALRGVSLVIARHRVKLSVEGLEHIPRSGPVLIAARHFHYFYDGYILVRTVPRRLHTIVALDWLQAQSLRAVIEFACALADWPVILRPELVRERAEDKTWAYEAVETRRYLRRVMRSAMRLLRAGELLVIFPEGYPNIDPHPTPKTDLAAFMPFRAGFVKMVELAERDGQTRVAIVPAGLMYTRTRDEGWQATVRFGSALFLDDFASTEETRRTVEERVQALSYALSPSTSLEPPGESPAL